MPIDNEEEDLILSWTTVIEPKTTEPTTDSKIITCVFNSCTEQEVRNCRKCSRPFCIMHSNRFSPNFCKECFSNLSCIESKFTRTTEDFNEKTNNLVITKESCTRYYMDGPDWPFVTAWIDTLEDAELKSLINFHYFVMKTIEAENEVRKIRKYKKIREQSTSTSTTSTSSINKIKVVKTTTGKIQTKDTEEELRKKFKKQGLPDIVIDNMIKAMALQKEA